MTEQNPLLGLLLTEAAQAREDDNYGQQQLGTVISVLLGLAVAMATLFYSTCPVNACPKAPSNLFEIPVWIYIAAPLVPIGLLAHAIVIATTTTLRSYYIRDIERRIHELTEQKERPIPYWGHLQLTVAGQTHASGISRLNWALIYATVAILVFGSVAISITKIPDIRLRLFALAIDTLLFALPVAAAAMNAVSGTYVWKVALGDLAERLRRTDDGFPPRQEPAGERPFASYLLLPRNQEELLKALFIPACLLIGYALVPGLYSTSSSWWYFAGFFFVFEFIVYQARYLLNDVRDRAVDGGAAFGKPRFPRSLSTDEGALRTAFISFIVRLFIATIFVGCLLPLDNFAWAMHAFFLSSVFLIALPYEVARSRCNVAASLDSSRQLFWWTVITVGVVGLGYGLRATVGFWLAGLRDSVTLILGALAASLFGSTFVALPWALESTRIDQGAIAKSGKAHFVVFRDAVSKIAIHNDDVRVGPDKKVLSGPQSPLTPWGIPAVLAVLALMTFVLYVLRDQMVVVHLSLNIFQVHLDVTLPILLLTATVLAALLSIASPASWGSVITLFSFAGIVAALSVLSVDLTQRIVASVVVIVPLVATCTFRNMCFNDLPGVMDKLSGAIVSTVNSLYKRFKRTR